MEKSVRIIFVFVTFVLLFDNNIISQCSHLRTGPSAFNEFSFNSVLDLHGYKIWKTPYDVKTNIRSQLDCGVVCGETCQMFSYDQGHEVCYLYKDLSFQDLQTSATNTDPGKNYFQRTGTVIAGCGAGMYQASFRCSLCSIGTYQDKPYQFSCKQCPKDHYQDSVGATTCIKCENSTNWRYSTDPQRTKCSICYVSLNSNTVGDMATVIKNVTSTSPEICGVECDGVMECEMFTWRSGEGKCYLHSTQTWSNGSGQASEVYIRGC